jgi:thymidylate synthase (FAD)
MSQKIDVLDRGYVRLRDKMGDDHTVANAARVSFDKRTDLFTPKDRRLLQFLAREGHKSPFAHAFLQFEVYAPMLVVRQWHKHRVGSSFLEEMPFDPTEAWNESSRRYVTENNEYYIPDVWRSAPENKKQGSGEPLSKDDSDHNSGELEREIIRADNNYNFAVHMGIAPEQARLFLPYAALYVRFYWSCSLLRVIEFLQLREADDAQSEIRQYANAVRQLTEPLFPESFKAWFGE